VTTDFLQFYTCSSAETTTILGGLAWPFRGSSTARVISLKMVRNRRRVVVLTTLETPPPGPGLATGRLEEVLAHLQVLQGASLVGHIGSHSVVKVSRFC
jgi:hypothetical protein